MATISDVAARAGVSTATVSRALNGKSTVAPELVARVAAAAQALGYQPHGPARNLRRQETAVLALIISDVENPFFTALARGVEDVAQADGFSVVLCNSDEDAEKERRYLAVALQERVAGVILSPSGAATGTDVLAGHGIPVVAVDRPLPAGTGDMLVDSVLVDSRKAALTATEHLMKEGYQRIACISGPAGVRTADDRVVGYQDAVRGGLELVRRTEYRAGGARAAAVDLFGRPDRPDAVLVANSAMAIGVLDALRELGLRPGRDVGLVAFDDAAWAGLVDPPLSVVAQPASEMGRVAARLLLARIAEPQRPPTMTTLAAHLIPRASSTR